MRFLIVATTRTGSMLLTSMLNSHPDLLCYGEESWTFCQSLGRRQGANVKYTDVERLSDQERTVRNIVLPSDDLSSFRIIHLVRRDLLALSISKVMNERKDLYRRPAHVYDEPELDRLGHIYSEQGQDTARMRKILKELPISTREHMERIRDVRVPMDAGALERMMEWTCEVVLRWQAHLEGRAPELMTVAYEEMAPEGEARVMPAALAARLCRFLGVEPSELRGTMAKVNDPDYGRYIENWEEIRDLRMDLRARYEEGLAGVSPLARSV